MPGGTSKKLGKQRRPLYLAYEVFHATLTQSEVHVLRTRPLYSYEYESSKKYLHHSDHPVSYTASKRFIRQKKKKKLALEGARGGLKKRGRARRRRRSPRRSGVLALQANQGRSGERSERRQWEREERKEEYRGDGKRRDSDLRQGERGDQKEGHGGELWTAKEDKEEGRLQELIRRLRA